MKIIENTQRGKGLPESDEILSGTISTDPDHVVELLTKCPVYRPSPLENNQELAANLDIGKIVIKDERQRMGLGSFKALGAAYVVAKAAFEKAPIACEDPLQRSTVLNGQTYICASAGNHGISVAAGARIFGAKAIIYLSITVPESFSERLKSYGAEVVIDGADYEESMESAKLAAAKSSAILISDSTWADYAGGREVMEGYLAMMQEITQAYGERHPTHIFLQAGVGGLAAAAAAFFRSKWGDDPLIFIVEPTSATALMDSIVAQKPVTAVGAVSSMGRLDCKDPSHLALKCLAKDADYFIALDDAETEESIQQLESYGLATSPSGGAGFAGLCALMKNNPKEFKTRIVPNQESEVLLILSEGPQEGD